MCSKKEAFKCHHDFCPLHNGKEYERMAKKIKKEKEKLIPLVTLK
jgi:hypothetical protein